MTAAPMAHPVVLQMRHAIDLFGVTTPGRAAPDRWDLREIHRIRRDVAAAAGTVVDELRELARYAADLVKMSSEPRIARKLERLLTLAETTWLDILRPRREFLGEPFTGSEIFPEERRHGRIDEMTAMRARMISNYDEIARTLEDASDPVFRMLGLMRASSTMGAAALPDPDIKE